MAIKSLVRLLIAGREEEGRGGESAETSSQFISSTAHQAQIIKLTGKGTIMCVIVLAITTGELPKETRK